MATQTIPWADTLQSALERAQRERKPVFLDFFTPTWGGCKKMDAVTYPHDDVQAELAERVVPIRIKVDDNGELAQRMGAIWTPGLLWLTPKGEVAHSNVGWFEPEEFQAELDFGCGKTAAVLGDWKRAQSTFDEVATRWPRTHAAPAARYWSGVAGYKATKDAGALKSAWTRLLDEFPDTAWAMKASFLRDKQ